MKKKEITGQRAGEMNSIRNLHIKRMDDECLSRTQGVYSGKKKFSALVISNIFLKNGLY